MKRGSNRMKVAVSVCLWMGMSAVARPVAPAFELQDVNGTVHSLAQYEGRIVVLEWTNYDCPFVKKFYSVGAMQSLQEEFAARGVVWLSVCSSAPGKQGHFTREEWRDRIERSGVKAAAVLLDESGDVGRAYGARNTPQFVIIDPEGRIAYQGAIDDRRSANPDDIAGARNYVEEALDALLAGRPVEVAETAPYGCTVKY